MAARKTKLDPLVFVISTVVLILIIGLLWLFLRTPNLVPPEVSTYSKDWPLANKDYSNTRATTDSTINSTNVASLGIEWAFQIQGISEWGAAATNPLILGNTIYLQDLKSNVYSIDKTTGKPNWIKIYNLNNAGPNGPAVANGKIFVAKGNYEVAALDLKGNEVWSKKVSDDDNVGIDIQASAYGNSVYICTVPGVNNGNFYKGGSVGRIYSLDGASGEIKWSFNTVDTQDIWGNPTVNSGGGCWYPPAIDTRTNLTYWGIANPAPWPGTKDFPNGSSRPGLNLYTNSMVALNEKDGKLAWFTQVLPHDLFDYDLQASPILANLNVNGITQDIVIGAGKMGKVFAFNRTNGEKLWETSVGNHMNDSLTTLPEGTTNVSPGPLGGVETVMAYADGVIYVPVVNMTVQYTPDSFVEDSFNLAAGTGEIDAIDASNGKILWSTTLDSIDVGGATVVNDLVFTSTFNGMIYALERSSGKVLWQYQANGGVNGSPAVSGDSIVFPVGEGQSPVLNSFKLNPSTLTTNGVPSFPIDNGGKGFQQ